MKKLLLILLFPFLIFSQNIDNWEDYLNGNEVTAVLHDGNYYYVGTKKGGVVIINTITKITIGNGMTLKINPLPIKSITGFIASLDSPFVRV